LDIDAVQRAAMAGAGGNVLATAAGVAKALLGEDDEDCPLVAEADGEVDASVTEAGLADGTPCEGAQAAPAINRVRPVISTVALCFRPSTPSNPGTLTPPGSFTFMASNLSTRRFIESHLLGAALIPVLTRQVRLDL
jgi:hypothetical protein